MSKFIAIAFAILLTVLLGVSVFSGDSNSVKTTVTNLLDETNSQIDEISVD
jgi:hypothetical protein